MTRRLRRQLLWPWYELAKRGDARTRYTSSMADVFLLGAGFSKAVNTSTPLMAELGAELKRVVHIPDENEEAITLTDDVEL